MKITKRDKYEREKGLKIGAIISLIVLLALTITQLITIFQTRYQLESPLIPYSVIRDINKKFIYSAIIFGIGSVIGFILYYLKKYIIIMIALIFTICISGVFYYSL